MKIMWQTSQRNPSSWFHSKHLLVVCFLIIKADTWRNAWVCVCFIITLNMIYNHWMSSVSWCHINIWTQELLQLVALSKMQRLKTADRKFNSLTLTKWRGSFCTDAEHCDFIEKWMKQQGSMQRESQHTCSTCTMKEFDDLWSQGKDCCQNT